MRYFFDIVGDHSDQDGTEFRDSGEMESAALRLLLEVALDKPKTGPYDLAVDVRDSRGDCIYRARLRLGGIRIRNEGSSLSDQPELRQ